MSDYLGALEEAVRPLAFRPSLSARDVSTLRQTLVRKRDWALPGELDSSIRAEHSPPPRTPRRAGLTRR